MCLTERSTAAFSASFVYSTLWCSSKRVLRPFRISTLSAMRGQDSQHYVAPFWTYPTHLLIIAVGAAAGGAVTGRITAERSAYSVFLLALILMMSALGPVIRHVPPAPGQPAWFALALAVVNPLAALAGGLLTRRAAARRRAAAA